MSWKLTKKLKDTHLAPLANTFSRTSSTSTIVNEKTQPASTAASTTSTDTNGIAASEANANPPPPPLKPGILIVTLHEGRGFSLPAGVEHAFGGRHGSTSSIGSGGFSVAGSMRTGSSSTTQGSVAGSYVSGRPQSATGGINAVPSSHGRYSSRYLPYALVDFDKQQVFINSVSGSPENPLWAGETTQYKFDVSRTTSLTLSLYIRNPQAPLNAGRSQDIFIGTCKVNPRFEEVHPYEEDPKLSKKDREKAAIAYAERQKTLGQ
ncbi:Serine/threonine-protein kinase, partial [Cryomyces antarcticus]